MYLAAVSRMHTCSSAFPSFHLFFPGRAGRAGRPGWLASATSDDHSPEGQKDPRHRIRICAGSAIKKGSQGSPEGVRRRCRWEMISDLVPSPTRRAVLYCLDCDVHSMSVCVRHWRSLDSGWVFLLLIVLSTSSNIEDPNIIMCRMLAGYPVGTLE